MTPNADWARADRASKNDPGLSRRAHDGEASGAPDYAALEGLLDAGELGVVTLDDSLVIRARHGRMLDWVRLGVGAVEAMPFLAGFDESLSAIGHRREQGFYLPRIAFAGLGPRGVFALRAFADPRPGWVVLLFQDANELAGLEQQIIQQRNELDLARAALETARDRAEAANTAKAAFLANVSHDLRTPLHVVIGNAEILRSDGERDAPLLEPAERKSYVRDIAESGAFLLTLIDDLLEMARADSDASPLEFEPLDLSALCAECVHVARRLPRAKGLAVRFASPDEAIVLQADRTRLKQVLLNLLGNAVKYTPAGGSVALDLRAAGDEIEIAVRDDGPGLSEDALAHLFERFSTHGPEGGSGLGLHIAKSLVERHGGRLEVTNAEDGGALARLRLPNRRRPSGDAA